MQIKEAILYALNLSDRAVLSAIDEMSDAPTTFPTPNGGCHPLWVIGHLALVEGSMPGVLFGEPNPVAHWQPLFGQESQPVNDRAAYPNLDDQYHQRLESYRGWFRFVYRCGSHQVRC